MGKARGGGGVQCGRGCHGRALVRAVAVGAMTSDLRGGGVHAGERRKVGANGVGEELRGESVPL